MKIKFSIFNAIIITITVLITIIVFAFLLTALCAKGCSEAMKEDLEKSQSKEGSSYFQHIMEKIPNEITDLVDSVIKTPKGTCKILKIREVPSGNPDRIGMLDIMVIYQKDEEPTNMITIPKEGSSKEIIKSAILENEERKKELRKLIEP